MSQQPPQQEQDKNAQLLNQHNNSDGVTEMATNTDAAANAAHQNDNGGSPSNGKGRAGSGGVLGGIFGKVYAFGGIRFLVLMILCLQNSMFTVLRRYSLGVLKEDYSKVRKAVALGLNEPTFMAMSERAPAFPCTRNFGTSLLLLPSNNHLTVRETNK